MRGFPAIGRLFVGAILVVAASAIALGVAAEMQTSRWQAEFLSQFASKLTFEVGPGPSPVVLGPADGPHDIRRGYAGLASYLDTLGKHDYGIDAQARVSPQLRDFVARGGFPVYREKPQAGLSIRDRHGSPLHTSRYPRRIYGNFEAVPPIIVATLLFIENRELLDPRHPGRNPAVEWDRLGRAAAAYVGQAVHPGLKVPGGSTLATQIEKYRHSPDGRTTSPGEKLRQVVSASVRAYLDGPDTTEWRHRLVVEYLNSTPLGARPGYGEVHGLGDGLRVWFGAELGATTLALGSPTSTPAQEADRALAYKRVLSLLLAQRRPTYYLMQDHAALEDLVEEYLPKLAAAGIIDSELASAARRVRLDFAKAPPETPVDSFIERKAVNAVRTELLTRLGVPSLYQLDQIDLTVDTSLDADVQARVTEALIRLADPEAVAELGLDRGRLLEVGDPGRVIYSLSLFERGADANYLRVQADNLDQPLDINDGAKLDLGSTAKLRTLVTYLEAVAAIHDRIRDLDAEALETLARDAPDVLTRWAARRLSQTGEVSLAAMLDAAMERRYSASPGEAFFTGGGLHTFVNFDKADNGRAMTVSEAFRKSVNLVFIRLMRDVVQYTIARYGDDAKGILASADHPARRAYLTRFADREGTLFLNRFYNTYAGHLRDETLDLLASRIRPTPIRLAVIFRSVRPEASREEFALFLRKYLPGTRLDEAAVARLYDKYGQDRFSLADRAYLARRHPLELWLVEYLQRRPLATRAEILAESADERLASYTWLFKTNRKRAQDTRIRILLEEEAFARIHADWRRLGYPFDRLVPSYATAIGSSADRPAALAELIGIILNHGVRLPSVRTTRLHFAEGTPYETVMGRRPAAGEQVMRPDVAATLRRSLIDIVERGTARRVKGAFVDVAGNEIAVGGKTGTGDSRHERYGRGGRVIESRVLARTATFAFFIGERFFGVITAHVAGPEAARYRFTSALPAQLLRLLSPALKPLIDGAEPPKFLADDEALPEPLLVPASLVQ